MATCLATGFLAPPAPAAAPAWQPVAATGPTVLPPVQSEVQSVYVDAEAGVYKLSFYATAGTGNVSSESKLIQKVHATAGAFAVGEPITGPGIPPGTTITGGFGENLLISQFATRTSTGVALAAGPVSTTADIEWDESASGVEAKLNALPTIGGAGSVSVVGGPGGPGAKDPYAVTFGSAFANVDVAQMTSDSTGLSSGDTHSATVATTVAGGPGTTTLALYAQNIGGFESSGTVTYKATLPAGVTTTGTPTAEPDFTNEGLNNNKWTCSAGAGQSEFSCTLSKAIPIGPPVVPPSYTTPAIKAEITAAAGAQSGTVHSEVSGGGAPTVTSDLPLSISSAPAAPGIQVFKAAAYDSNGRQDTRAGGHPYSASTAIFANSRRSVHGTVVPSGDFKDIVVDLPPGFIGNPIAAPQCPEGTREIDCPLDTVVGLVKPITSLGGTFGENGFVQPVYNTAAPFGTPAKFRFNILGATSLNATGSLRSDGDYGVSVSSLNTPQISQVYGVFFTFWGSPADPSHDATRCSGKLTGAASIGRPIVCEASDQPNVAFLTSATDCAEQAGAPPVTFLHSNTWQDPASVVTSSVSIPPVTGCDKLHFEGGLSLRSSSSSADSAASFKTSIAVPSEGLTDASKLTNPEIKRTVVELPKGVSLNASGADGLQSCSEQQIGYLGGSFPMPNPMHFDKDPNSCPDASKIGTGELKTPLLVDPLHGDLYLAAQGDGNPFGSLFAIYLVIEDPRHGIFIKLPGKVEPDGESGQLTVSFDNLPQLPFSELDLTLKGGDRSPLATPQTCGAQSTVTTFTPWSAPESGPAIVSEDALTIDSGANGAPCASSEAALPFRLGFDAGTAEPLAGAHSSFAMHLARPDGAQNLDGFELTTPEGFTASLRGVPYCSEATLAHAASNGGRAEQASPSCPAASQIGTTTVGAGAGPRPFYVGGKVYLSGPYRGSRISLAAIVPAVAGPFDLGTQVVRAALRVNPRTAQLTAVTDPLPKVIDGVPLRIRDVRVNVDRPDFALNPTDCSAQQVSAKVTGTGGAVASLSRRFQVGGCDKLGFKPKLGVRLDGGTRRGAHPALHAVLKPRPGDANIGRAAVTLPHSAFLDQGHIRTICTRVQFAADACPKGAIYGHARATTPLLDNPLEGPVYLRSSDNKLPDLVAVLHGQVDVEVVGRIDSVNGGIRNTFDVVPDAPVSRFVLNMQGGKKGLVVNSTNLCAKAHRATVKLTAQNNLRHDFRPKVVPVDCKKVKQGKH